VQRRRRVARHEHLADVAQPDLLSRHAKPRFTMSAVRPEILWLSVKR
jgi:hypothetical protein